jgi:hypothetical protein
MILTTIDPDQLDLTLPFTNYVGPGTKIRTKVLTRTLPTSRLDAAALIHDIEYLGISQKEADENMRYNTNSIYHIPLKAAFAMKDLYGYEVEQNLTDYAFLRDFVTRDPEFSELLRNYDVHFSDYRPPKKVFVRDIRRKEENTTGDTKVVERLSQNEFLKALKEEAKNGETFNSALRSDL